MNTESGEGKPEQTKKVKSSNEQCITCNKSCSMSGLCMKPWPEFPAEAKKKAIEHSRGKKSF